MTLKEQGYRFVKRGGLFRWSHPMELQANDLDCTDMSDSEFEMVVLGQALSADAGE